MKILLLTILIIALTFRLQGQSQSDLLNQSYNDRSIELLNQFFQNWSNETKISDADFNALDDTAKQVYNVFKGFYKPLQISSLYNVDSFYSNSKYYILQNSINRILLTDNLKYTEYQIDSLGVAHIESYYKDYPPKREILLETNGKLRKCQIKPLNHKNIKQKNASIIIIDSLFNINPFIKDGKIKSLVLTPKYERIMIDFIGALIGWKKDIKTDNESRKSFLDNFITIDRQMYGWYLHTYPYVESITFDKEMQHAKIDFEIFQQGGEAILKRVGNNWIIIQIEKTWVQ